MRYLTYISNSYIPKNKLEKDILSYLESEERRVVDDLDRFQHEVVSRIKKLNIENHKCIPKDPTWWAPNSEGEHKDVHLHGQNVCVFSLLAIAPLPGENEEESE